MARFRRARTEEKKKQREQDIINSALVICDERGLDAVSFESVAQYLGLTRPLIYSYFRTREELIAAMLDREIRAWTDDLVITMAPLNGSSADEIADAWTGCMSRHVRLATLCAARNVMAADGVSNESNQRLVARMAASKDAALAALDRVMGTLDRETGSVFYDMQMSLAVGLESLRGLTRSAAECMTIYSRSVRGALRQYNKAPAEPVRQAIE